MHASQHRHTNTYIGSSYYKIMVIHYAQCSRLEQSTLFLRHCKYRVFGLSHNDSEKDHNQHLSCMGEINSLLQLQTADLHQ